MEKNAKLLQSPSLVLSADSNKTVTYERDPQNFITQLFGEQLPPVKTGFFNVRMSKDVIVQPHWHTNATELVIVLSGEVVTTVFNPFSQKLMTYRIGPGEVSMFPEGWFHWIVSTCDHTHFLTVFDVPTPDIVLGSDFLRFTPKEIMELAYCADGDAYAKAVAPIQQSVIFGPPPGCETAAPVYQAAPVYAAGYSAAPQPAQAPVNWGGGGMQQGYMYQQPAAAAGAWSPAYAYSGFAPASAAYTSPSCPGCGAAANGWGPSASYPAYSYSGQ